MKPLWVYQFSVSVDAERPGANAAALLATHAHDDVQMPFTEKGFAAFRADLLLFGLTLHSIVRTPWNPEAVP